MSRSVCDVLNHPHRGESIRLTVDVRGDVEAVMDAITEAGGRVHDVDRFDQLDTTIPETAVKSLQNHSDVYAVNAEGDIELASEGN